MGEIIEPLIIAFIVVGIGAAIWRGGATNPVGTGGLDKRLTKVGSEVHQMRKKVGEIEGWIERVERSGATAEDISRLEVALSTHAADLRQVNSSMNDLAKGVAANHTGIERVTASLPDLESRQRALADQLIQIREDIADQGAGQKHITRQVDRLYDVLVKRGVEK